MRGCVDSRAFQNVLAACVRVQHHIAPAPSMLQNNVHIGRRQRIATPLWPFHEQQRRGRREVGQAEPFQFAGIGDAIEVEVMHVEQSGCLGAAIAAAVGSGVYGSFADAMAAMCPAGAPIEPDAESFSAYREKYAAFRRLAETLSALPAGR